MKPNTWPLYCSFCGKGNHEVVKLIAGPTVFICNECVDLCNDIIYGEHWVEGLKQIRQEAREIVMSEPMSKVEMMHALFPPPADSGIKWELDEATDTWKAYAWSDYGRTKGELMAEVKCDVFTAPRQVTRAEMDSYLATRQGFAPPEAVEAHAAAMAEIGETGEHGDA